MKKQKYLQKQRGITLIALIITIIVLVILAAVAINVALNTGIIGFASKGVKDYAEAGVEENRVMNKAIDFMTSTVDKIEGILGETGGKVPETLEEAMTTKYEFKSNKTYEDGGKSITIPAGFHIVGPEDEQTEDRKVEYGDDGLPNIDDGIVVEDGAGNQFVWIPVSKDGKELTRTSFDGSENPTTLSSNYYEPSQTGYQYEGEETEYNTMVEQVKAYEGFYIGRYEAGVDNDKLREGPTEAEKVVSKAGVAPYNWVKWGDSMTNIGTRGAVYLAKNKYDKPENVDSVESTLVYRCEWDAMCRFIGPGEKGAKMTAETKDAPELTGSVSTDKVKNIYDLAGNCMEWAMETYKTVARDIRGGSYFHVRQVSNRGNDYPVNGGGFIGYGFRLSLYIKGTPEG